MTFLQKEKVSSGEAVETAKTLYKSRQKEEIIQRTLPKAWETMLLEKDEMLLELLAEKTENLCGYKPSLDVVATFLETYRKSKEKTTPSLSMTQNNGVKPLQEQKQIRDFTFAKVKSFTFLGKSYEAKSWRNLYLQLIKIIAEDKGPEFERVLQIRGRVRPHYAKTPSNLRMPERIKGTDIYVETNLSANSIVNKCHQLIRFFGYDENDFRIFLEENE
jgi:hypothetical protein